METQKTPSIQIQIESNKTVRNTFEQGAAVLEMALLLPILFLFVVASVDYGHGLSDRQVMTGVLRNGLRSGSRLSLVNAPALCTDVIKEVKRTITFNPRSSIVVIDKKPGGGPSKTGIFQQYLAPEITIRTVNEGGADVSIIEATQTRSAVGLFSIPEFLPPFPEVTVTESFRLEAPCV